MGFRSVLRFLPLPLEVEDAALATFLAFSIAAFLIPSEPFMMMQLEREEDYGCVACDTGVVSPGYRGLSALGAAGSDSDYRALWWWWFSGRMYPVAAG